MGYAAGIPDSGLRCMQRASTEQLTRRGSLYPSQGARCASRDSKPGRQSWQTNLLPPEPRHVSEHRLIRAAGLKSPETGLRLSITRSGQHARKLRNYRTLIGSDCRWNQMMQLYWLDSFLLPHNHHHRSSSFSFDVISGIPPPPHQINCTVLRFCH